MTVPGNIDALLLGGQQGYQIERSLRFNSADSAYLSRTPASTGTSRRVFTISLWLKRSALLASALDFGFINAGGDATTIGISGTGAFGAGLNNTVFLRLAGNIGNWPAVFRDTSAWYHFVVAIDSTQATAANRQKLYVNGVDQGACSGSLTQNVDTAVSHTGLHLIGAFNGPSAGYYANGYLAEYHLIDGQALTPSSFGETDSVTGVWKPKKYAGTYGTNGFYLKFADNSGTTSTTLGKDSSGNGNNWTPNNFSVTAGAGNDSLIDTPTPYADGGNGRGNYCTGNPLYTPSTQSRMSLTNGNLEWGQAAINANSSMTGTFEMRSGKWYWEVTVGGSFNYSSLGIQTTTNTAWRGGGTVLYRSDGQKVIGGTNSAYGSSFTTNDVIGFAYDADAGSLTCYKNNTSQGVIYSSGTGNIWVPCAHDDNAGSGVTYYHQCNFGQRPFAYTPPSGFVALNTQNLPEPSIKKPGSYMDTVLYTGTGVARSITGLGFSPDFVWTKVRSSANDHKLYDAVRGATKVLESSNTGAEGTDTQGLTAFNSDGFSLGTASSSNANGSTYVAWCWDESATPGFDIVTYTGNGVSGRTVAHGLGVSPSLVIVKNRTSGGSYWSTAHISLSSGYNLLLNDTGAQFIPGNSAYGGISTYSSTTFTVVTGTVSQLNVNTNNDNYVAYLWSEVAGFSKFGSYTGNGSSDGPFVFCGFRPRFIMFKRSDASSDWRIQDTSRSTSNQQSTALMPNLSNSEDTGANVIDVLSNGFKARDSGAFNTSSATYIFAAFAEAPFKYSLAR